MRLDPVLTIAGSDSSGGAGIQADLKTITMLRCYGMSAVTALTAQNTVGVSAIYPISADFLTAQLKAVCEDIRPAAVKIGMVYDVPQIAAIAAVIRHYALSAVVVDPVMLSTSGDALMQQRAVSALETELFPLAQLITPNLPEAERLCGRSITDKAQMAAAAQTLSEKYQTAVLLKSGHRVGDCDDLLYMQRKSIWMPGKRCETPHTHGTGCTLSSAIVSFLARGFELEGSVRQAKKYVTQAISAGLALGHGHGPIAHNFAIIDEKRKG